MNEKVFEIPGSVTFMILWNSVGIVNNPWNPVTNLFTLVASPPMIWKLHCRDESALRSTCPYAYVMSNVEKNVLLGPFPTFLAIISTRLSKFGIGYLCFTTFLFSSRASNAVFTLLSFFTVITGYMKTSSLISPTLNI